MKPSLILFVLLLTGCPPPKPAPMPTGSECARFCAHLEQLSCPEAKATPTGETCVEVCENVSAEGIDPTCQGRAAEAATCAQAVQCE